MNESNRFVWSGPDHVLSGPRATIDALWFADETAVVESLLGIARLEPAAAARVLTMAEGLVVQTRAARVKGSGVDALMREYDLSSHEGMVLMCLAEALLRVPDAGHHGRPPDRATRSRQARLGRASRVIPPSIFVNAVDLGR